MIKKPRLAFSKVLSLILPFILFSDAPCNAVYLLSYIYIYTGREREREREREIYSGRYIYIYADKDICVEDKRITG